MRYRLSPLAEHDLQDLWAYVASVSGDQRGDTVLDAIFERIEMLAVYPRAGRRRPEFGAGVRSIVVESRVIYYREQERILSIARVLHGRRDQLAVWEEEAGATIRNREPHDGDEAESGIEVELTRRGQPVAVLVSRRECDRLQGTRRHFSDRKFVEQHSLEAIGVESDFAASTRDRTTGRKVRV